MAIGEGDGVLEGPGDATVGKEEHDAEAEAVAAPSPSGSLPHARSLRAAPGSQAHPTPMATSCVIGDSVLEGAGDATVGKEEHDAEAEVASSPSGSLPHAPSLRAAPGSQAHPTTMADASSSSFSIPLARSARSEAYQTPATPWVIVDRFLRTGYDSRDALTGAEAQAQAQAQQAAAAPDLTLPLALPPMVTVVSAGPGAQSDPSHPDEYPCVVCAANLGLLIEFTEPSLFNVGVNTSDDVSHLMLARHFHTADGQTTATVERLTDRTDKCPGLKCLEAIVFSSNDTGEYLIAELQVDECCDIATLVYLESGRDEWDLKSMDCPLMLDSRKKVRDRKWVPHGSASDERMLWWFDLSWGILSCDTSALITEGELFFHELPAGRALDQTTRDIKTQRCIMLSKKLLRYVEIIPEEESATLIMWTLSCISPPGWHWIKKYEMSFEHLWSGDSYKSTRLPRQVPALSVVSPSDPDLVYFALGQQLFGVNVPELRVVHNDAYQLSLSRPASARYVVPWELPSAIGQGIKLGHNTIAPDDERISSSQKDDTILAVWKNNLEKAFNQIEVLIQTKEANWIIGMDTEFCPQELPALAWKNPPFGDESYAQMRHSVDEGDLVQVGLAIANWDNPQGTHVFEFNLHFDPKTRPHNSAKVAFLKRTNPYLEEHADNGIMLDKFIDRLNKCGVLQNTAVTWVTYQGFADYGYLLRGLEGVRRMPESRRVFLNSVEKMFPKNYDLKTFQHKGICCEIPEKRSKKDFEALSQSLKAERRGTAHTAGSDALLTVHCFFRIAAREIAFDPLLKWQRVLFGISTMVACDTPAICYKDVRVVSVDSRNIQRERTEIEKLFPMYGYVSAELKFSFKQHMQTERYDIAQTGRYDIACQDLACLSIAEIAIAISDSHGWPAHGKVWKFKINEEDNITSGMLAKFLTKVGAISNPGMTWISSDVGFFLHMVNVCTTASLPNSRHQFNTLLLGYFPKLYIVQPVPGEESECDTGLKVLLTLRKFLLLKQSNDSSLEFRKPLF